MPHLLVTMEMSHWIGGQKKEQLLSQIAKKTCFSIQKSFMLSSEPGKPAARVTQVVRGSIRASIVENQMPWMRGSRSFGAWVIVQSTRPNAPLWRQLLWPLFANLVDFSLFLGFKKVVVFAFVLFSDLEINQSLKLLFPFKLV